MPIKKFKTMIFYKWLKYKNLDGKYLVIVQIICEIVLLEENEKCTWNLEHNKVNWEINQVSKGQRPKG